MTQRKILNKKKIIIYLMLLILAIRIKFFNNKFKTLRNKKLIRYNSNKKINNKKNIV